MQRAPAVWDGQLCSVQGLLRSKRKRKKNDTNKERKKTSRIQLIFYYMKVSQGRLESHVNTIPEYRFVSLFYKSRSSESLSDHYYHTNRQIYLTTPFLSHNTYSLVLLPERHWNASPPSFFPFFFSQGNRLRVDKGSEQ